MTDLYAVIGNPIAHSKSPFIHSEFARQTGQSLQYGALLAPVDGFIETVNHFRSQGGKGLNVTVPFKLQACEFASKLSASARQAQAVNLLHFKDNEIFGDNTDGLGLVRDIRENLQFLLKGKKILLMGAGGAARGVMLPLLNEKPERITIVNRTLEKAVLLKDIFSPYGRVDAAAYEDLTDHQFDLIINATSTSLQNTLPPLSPGLFAKEALAYDMVYGKTTPFLEFARKEGVANRFDGIGMLVEQAAESFFIWRNIRPDTAAVIKQLKQII
jgi:shikimate dehydrogenase